MLRRFAPLVLLVVLCLPFTVQAQTDGVGLGASIGVTNNVGFANPVGFAGKGWLSDRQAIAGMSSFFIGSENQQSYWILQGDYLFHNFNELQVEEGYLALYVGAGAQFTVLEDTDNQFGIRAPIGADYILGSAPIDIFVEVAPTLNVTDPTSLRFDGAIGFRYFFSSGGSSE
mgnify:FL=1